MSDEYEGNKRREMRWEQMRGTPLPKSTDEVWKERHLLQEQYITELENRLRALWDKYDGDSKHYIGRINRLEEVATNQRNRAKKWYIEEREDGDSVSIATTRAYFLAYTEIVREIRKAKEAKP